MKKVYTTLAIGGAISAGVFFFRRSLFKISLLLTVGVAAFVWWKNR